MRGTRPGPSATTETIPTIASPTTAHHIHPSASANPGMNTRLPVWPSKTQSDTHPVTSLSGRLGSDSGPTSISSGGIGLPTTTRLRTYQKAPVRTRPPDQAPAETSRNPRGAITTTPIVRAPTAGTNVHFAPIARPAASAATSTGPSVQRRWAPEPISTATALRRSDSPTMSVRAAPACVVISVGVPTIAIVAAIVTGATPKGAPTDQPASNAIASQPRFTNGDNRSLPTSITPRACSTSELKG